MRHPTVFVALLLASPVVSADTALRPVVDLANVDGPCRPLASSPRNAVDAGPAWDAYLSVANCEVMVRTRALVLTPMPASRDALEHAIRPSLELLAHVIEQADLPHQIMAQQAQADIYTAIAVRLEITAGPPPAIANTMADDAWHLRVEYVNMLAQPWRDRAVRADREVARLVDRDPRIVATNPVIARMVARNRSNPAPIIGTR